MIYRIFSENEWVYPDYEICESRAGGSAVLYAARGSDVCFQLLTDIQLEGGETVEYSAHDLGADAEVYQLLKAHVGMNSAATSMTTANYDEVKHFVTRKAPFEVYEATMPLDGGILKQGRAAFYVRVNVGYDAVPGTYNGAVTINAGNHVIQVPVELKIFNVQVPGLKDSEFHMINWLYYDKLAEQHGVKPYSEEYGRILYEYLKNQLDMRNDYLMIPAGTPIRDENGKVVDFDFTEAEYVGRLAVFMGFKYVMGGFVARFKKWDDPDNMLLWDREVGCTTIEGFRQLKIYFRRAWECVTRNGWEHCYMQCLVDEPQFPNSPAYRALSGICRQNMPGVTINDPVETTDIAGAVDVWVVKQAVFEKHIENFRKLQNCGEEMWIYTCGFPAGAVMNRVVDLPLTVSRLPMWMCYKYNCPGFLHWGYHWHDEGLDELCTTVGENLHYPAGNAHVIYTGDGRPWYSVRGHSQRNGACDWELFNILGKRDRKKALELIEKCCRTFADYDSSAELFDQTRRELLEILG